MFVRSERLFLRPAWPEDAREIHAAIADEAIVRNLARAPWPYTEADARDFVQIPSGPRTPRFLVTVPGACGAEIVGNISLFTAGGDGVGDGEQAEPREAEVGYWIARRHWGRGFASEALTAVSDLAAMLGYRRLVGWHFSDNPASGRVMARAGFRLTGQTALHFGRARNAHVRAVGYARALRPGSETDPDSESEQKRAA